MNTMRNPTLLILAGILAFASCQNQSATDTEKDQLSPTIVNIDATASGEDKDSGLPVFSFEESTFDFGTITSGEEVTHTFKFKNTGDADLLISQANASCGCTSPEYPKEPIKPGDEGEIKVTFRSEGIAGQVAKTVSVLANTSPTTKVLTLSGEVIKKNQ